MEKRYTVIFYITALYMCLSYSAIKYEWMFGIRSNINGAGHHHHCINQAYQKSHMLKLDHTDVENKIMVTKPEKALPLWERDLKDS